MARANLVNKHDYMMVAVHLPEGRISMTLSHSGIKITTKPGVMTDDQANRLFGAFHLLVEKGKGNYGDRMNRVLRCGLDAGDVEDLIVLVTDEAV